MVTIQRKIFLNYDLNEFRCKRPKKTSWRKAACDISLQSNNQNDCIMYSSEDFQRFYIRDQGEKFNEL